MNNIRNENKRVYMAADELASGFFTKQVYAEGGQRTKITSLRDFKDKKFPNLNLSTFFNGTDQEVESFLKQQKEFSNLAKEQRLTMRNITGVVCGISYENEKGKTGNGRYEVSIYTKSNRNNTIIYVLSLYERDMFTRDFVKVLDQIELGKVYRFSFNTRFSQEEGEFVFKPFFSIYNDKEERLYQKEDNKKAFKEFSEKIHNQCEAEGKKATKVDYDLWHKQHFFDKWLENNEDNRIKDRSYEYSRQEEKHTNVVVGAQVSYNDSFKAFKNYIKENNSFFKKTEKTKKGNS